MFNFLLKLFFLFLMIYTYISIYYVIKVNIYNDLNEYTDDLTRINITNEVAFKHPFYFNAPHLINDLCLNDCSLLKEEKYFNLYVNEEYNINDTLLPYTKYDINHKIYNIKSCNKPIFLYENKSIRNFYTINNGKIELYIIHPKYKSNLNLWDNKNIKSKQNKKNS